MMRHLRTSTRGFTLLETLIALALTTMLLGMIWTILSLYTRLDEKGSEAAVEMQLVRTLHSQLQEDLQSVLTMASNPSRSNSNSTQGDSPSADRLAEVAFRGDQRSMEFLRIGSQLPWEAASPAGTPAPGEPALGPAAAAMATEAPATMATGSLATTGPVGQSRYRKIQYQFEPSPVILASPYATLDATSDSASDSSLLASATELGVAAAGGAAPGAPAGNASTNAASAALIPVPDFGLRRESAPWPAAPVAVSAGSNASAASGFADLQSPDLQSSGEELAALDGSGQPSGGLANSDTWDSPVPVATRDVAPEVVRLEFRYFDGSSWLESWSPGSGSLPRAVEVRLDVDTTRSYREQLESWKRQLMPAGAGESQTLGPAPAEFATGGTSSAMDDALGTASDAAIWIPEYRFVIGIPLASDTRPQPTESTAEGGAR